MPNTLFRNVRLLDLGRDDGMSECCDLRVRNGTIAEIAQSLAPMPLEALIDGYGDLLMPGLINAHFHSSVNHMKGRLPGLPLEIFMLYECPELDVLRPSPREAYLRTMLGCIEMLENGTTAVQDDCFFVPEPTHDVIDAVMQAYVDSGMRARVALDQPEVPELDKLPYLRELVPPELRAELARAPGYTAEGLLALYDYLIDTWHGQAAGRLQAAVSCSAPQRVTPDYFRALDDLSRKHDLPFYVHMLETRLQRVFGNECLGGRSLVRYAADLGMLSERMNIIHAIWVDDDDLDLIAASGAQVAHNPNSNLRLGSGIMPFRAIRDRGIPVCLGVDEAIADDAINMWSVMKTAGMLHSLTATDYRHWPQAHEVLHAATAGGGRAMRVAGLGTLTIGAPADLILVSLESLAFLPLNNLPRQLVHCENGRSVRLTMVGGEVVAKDGRVSRIDRDAIMGEARSLFQSRSKALADASAAMDDRLAYYRQMYLQAMDQDVGMERRVPAFR